MNIHEYQAKNILKSYGVAIQEGVVVDNIANDFYIKKCFLNLKLTVLISYFVIGSVKACA